MLLSERESLVMPRQSADRCFDISPQRAPLIQGCSDLQAVLLLQSLPTSQPSSSASKNLLLPFTTTATPVLHQAFITPGSSCQELPMPLSLFSAFQFCSPYLLLSICSVLLCNLCCSISLKPLQLSALLSSLASSILRKHSEEPPGKKD